MNEFGLVFHHLGLAVSQPAATLKFLAGLGYMCGETVYDEIQNVNLIMCTHPTAPDIEVISSAGNHGPLDNLLRDHHELIYHICYETENLALALEQVKKACGRVLCVSAPKPAVLFSQRQVSFYQVKHFGLIEILEKG